MPVNIVKTISLFFSEYPNLRSLPAVFQVFDSGLFGFSAFYPCTMHTIVSGPQESYKAFIN
jgi:hypothetical protein